MWNRRQCTKFNGTPYIIQYAGAKVFTEEGMKECQENIGYYRENARMIAETLEKKRISFTGGVNSPSGSSARREWSPGSSLIISLKMLRLSEHREQDSEKMERIISV